MVDRGDLSYIVNIMVVDAPAPCCRQGIGNHEIDIVLPEYFGISIGKVNDLGR